MIKNANNYKEVFVRHPVHISLLMQVLSRDSVTVSVEAVVYYRVSNPTMAVR